MKIKEDKIKMLKLDFEYLIRFEKYIKENEPDIYKKAFNFSQDKKNSYYEN